MSRSSVKGKILPVALTPDRLTKGKPKAAPRHATRRDVGRAWGSALLPSIEDSILLEKADSVSYEKRWGYGILFPKKESEKRLTTATILMRPKVKALKRNENQRPCRKEED